MTSDNSAHVKKAPVIRFRGNTTLSWPMRDGDSLIWFRARGASNTPDSMMIEQRWNFRDGDAVILTNRVVDIPVWFELHPDDVCNAQCFAAESRLTGKVYLFTAPDTGQHIWRIPAGNRLAWIGDPREGLEGKDGVLAVLDCEASVLVLGQPATQSEESFKRFGISENTKTPKLDDAARHVLAREAVYNLGVSRTMGMYWRLGDGQ